MAEVLPIIAGRKHKDYRSANDVVFTRIRPFDKDLTRAKPDSYDGAAPEHIHRRVRTDLNDLIVPANRTDKPAAPNFFIEGKSMAGRSDIAKLQACHNGAIGARAMHSLQNYGADEDEYDGNAYSFTSAYHNGTSTLQLYAHHPTPPIEQGGNAGYPITQIKAFAMTSDSDTCRKGATYFRNARKLAKEMRDSHIGTANETARALSAESLSGSRYTPRNRHSTISAARNDASETSIDELALSPAPPKRSRHATASSTPTLSSAVSDLPMSSNTSAGTILDNARGGGYARTRRTNRQTPFVNSKATHVNTSPGKYKGEIGRVFQYEQSLVFVPDED